MDKNNLANRLLYLPLDIHEKVLLWLTYKELKPVSEITAESRGNIKSLLKKGIRKASTYQFDSPNSLRIRGWIKDAGLVISFEEKYGSAWHISKDKKLANESVESLQKYDYNSEVKSGKLFGFPIESVKTYAKNRGKPYEEIQKIMVGTGDSRYENEFLKDKYFTPYIFYNIPKNRVEQDSQIAKKWADTIRKDVPKLAQWFEKSQFPKN